MKKSYIFLLSFFFAAALVACNPIMETPTPGGSGDPTRPDAPPQVIFVTDDNGEKIEVTSIAIQGNFLYATAPTKNMVYRMRIDDMQNLSRLGNAVPWAEVPGANAITAGANNTLFIGASGAPKFGANEHKWTDDKVIYAAKTTDSWVSRCAVDIRARRMFEAPRGSFNALTIYNNGLYYAAGTPLEGMGINSNRYMRSLDAVVNLLDADLNFLIQLIMGEADFSNIEIGDILRLANLLKLNLNLDALNGNLEDLDTDALLDLVFSNLDNFLSIGMNGSSTTITLTIPVNVGDLWGALTEDLIIPIPVPINLSALSLDPQWALNLVTIWAPPLEIPFTEVATLMNSLLTPAFWAENTEAIRNAAKGFVATLDFDSLLRPVVIDLLGSIWGPIAMLGLNAIPGWQNTLKGYANDAVDGFITPSSMTANLSAGNIEALIKDYIFVDDADGVKKISLNGIYKDQPGQYPPRPYFMGKAISPSDFFDEDRNLDLKLALTLGLLQLKGVDDAPFSVIDGQPQFDAFMEAISGGGNILDQIKGVVDALELKRLLDDGQLVIGNPRLQAYLQFIVDVSDSSFELCTTIDKLFALIQAFDISIDFKTLLNAWSDLPDWSEIPHSQVGAIAPDDLLGGIYSSIDNFVNDIDNGFLQGLAGHITSKIPKVNSAQAFSYGGNGVNPTGLAFGRDAQGFDAGWIVDDGTLYALNLCHNNKTLSDLDLWNAGGTSAKTIERDDYKYDATYTQPQSPWTRNSRGRWVLNVASVSSPKTNLANVAPGILEDSWGVIYDDANQRVLVSCRDGSNKGRVVSVRYKSWTTIAGQQYPGFFPPPPRLPIRPFSTLGAYADFDIQEYIVADGELDQPKGMAIKDNYLFIADGDRIVVYYMGKTATP